MFNYPYFRFLRAIKIYLPTDNAIVCGLERIFFENQWQMKGVVNYLHPNLVYA